MAGLMLFCRVTLCALGLLSLEVKGFNHGGSEFHVTFLPFPMTNLVHEVKLYVTTPEHVPVNFTISIPGQNYYRSATVNPGEMEEFIYNEKEYAVRNTTDRSKGIIITAENERQIFVYGALDINRAADSFLALPPHNIGTASYTYMAAMIHTLDRGYIHALVGIVSTENDTLLTITPSRDVTIGTESVQAGRSVLVTLHRAETLLIAFVGDLTGTKVTSNRPISFFSGDQCTNVPGGVPFCDQIIEQLPPVEAWGRQFATAPLKTRLSFDVFRFVASENSTTVDISCTLGNGNQGYADEFILNEGAFADVQVNSTDFCWMEADKNILLLQFAVGFTEDNVPSDPFMALVPAVIHYTNSFTLPIVNSSLNDFTHYLNIIIPAEHYQPEQIFFDGQSLRSQAFQFTAIVHNGETMAYAAQVEVSAATHTLIHGNSTGLIGVMAYGFAYRASYGHVGGMRFPQFNNAASTEATTAASTDATTAASTDTTTAASTDATTAASTDATTAALTDATTAASTDATTAASTDATTAASTDATTAALTDATTAASTDATTAASTDTTTAASTDTTTAASTNETITEYNGIAIPFILAGVMGFLVFILATVMLGIGIICICFRVCKSCRKRKKTDADIYATAHSVILEQNPAYDCVPVHLKPTANVYQEIRRGYPPSLAQGNIYA